MEKYNLIKNMEPVKIEKSRNNRISIRYFICEKCNKEYSLNSEQYRSRKRQNNFNLCFDCTQNRVAKLRSENRKKYHDNLSEEQKIERNKKLKQQVIDRHKNMSKEQKNEISKKISIAYQNKTQEEKEEINKKRSISLKNYYNNLYKEEWQEWKRQISIGRNRNKLLDKEVLRKEIIE